MSKVAGLEVLDHWDRLKKLHLYSQERRRERYMILFLWKISEGLVKGYDISFTESDRRGKMAVPKPYVRTAPASVRRAREASLGVKGCRLFNILPESLRSIHGTTLDIFKRELDNFLSTIPDQPTVPGLQRAAETNSLIHQIFI
jgi:hypothetical protein